MSHAYAKLEEKFALTGKLIGAEVLLYWDRSVVMPPKAAPAHADIAAALTAIRAEKATDPQIGEYLAEAERERHQLDDWQRANLVEMARHYRHMTAVPPDLLARKTRAAAELHSAWPQARASDDFSLFSPGLKDMLEIVREIAECKAQALECSPYDALLDELDPGIDCELIERLFTPLESALPALIGEIREQQKDWTTTSLGSGFSDAQQRELSEFLMERIGYPLDHGRLDLTAHPFALPWVPGDQRIATHFKEDNLRFAIMAVIHEAGHAMYEHHLPLAWGFQPVGMARGTTLHESQSLMLEMMAARSPEFVEFLAAALAKRFGQSAAFSPDNIRRCWHRVWPGLIRIEADEVTYPLHVILRYRIERALLDGSLQVDDLPDAWNAQTQDLLGIRPCTLADGCLQDVHWSHGMFAYFPNYALGEAAAAQFFEAAVQGEPAIADGLRRGEFDAYFDWVRPRIHDRASSVPINQIIEDATGAPLGADALLRHFRLRYLDGG